MTDKYAELRRLAEAATPGPWEVKHTSDGDVIQTEYERGGWEIADERADVPHQNAAFIAAANPSTILSLLDELEACRKDAERYRWLRNQEAEYGISAVFISGWERAATCWATTYPDARDLDAAIDAAMQEQKP